ncbi:Protein pelota [Metallosphaera sp. J1]|uniref:mRNA surveillance protein pelota n=1 Tax=Metallosphaera TaxID=41980 RepID=UPI001EDD8620|nr:mRNA surveillance protein pelota [Metallosphaera javensis (ex Hofmann et al. 2022)]MCG3107986.1 Protein pelota [Metallosphaera javensis (ex Hofmann et al. 2022)]BCS91859.1 MAG: mRNA surveillance protein Pelota [Metallosphaera javensis (ex Sakai et al. 2022)]
MKILEYDEKAGALKLHVENEDDLWLIHLVLNKGDIVVARTTRDVSMGNDSRRIPMVVELEVEFSEFQPFTSRLRIHGIVRDAPERYSIKGSHHTINLDIGDEIVIIKKWTKGLIDRIKKQAEKNRRVLIVLTDQDELLVALPMEQGIRILTERSLPGVSDEDKSLENAALEVSKEVEQYVKQYSPDAIIIAGPGPFKEIVRDKLKVKARIYMDNVSSASRAGLNEILRRDVIDEVMRDYQISIASRELERGLSLLAQGSSLVVYGREEVERASQIGAVETLLVTDDLLTLEDEETRKRTEEIMEAVESKGGKVMIVPKDSPVYLQLKNLTGLLAILRFRIN